jgi:predicted GIY-YIG superfamily endonuclease
MFYVYILKSQKDGTFYIGLTDDLKSRLIKHNKGESKYTKGRLPWKLIWYCVFNNKSKAADFEKYLKTGSVNAFFNKRLV